MAAQSFKRPEAGRFVSRGKLPLALVALCVLGVPDPYQRTCHAQRMIYDSNRAVTVRFDSDGQTSRVAPVEWDGASWTPVDSVGPAFTSFAAAFDSWRNVTVLVGVSSSGIMETWEWDRVEWTFLTDSSAGGPSPCATSTMVFDSVRGLAVLWGYRSSTSSAAPSHWEWDGEKWHGKASSHCKGRPESVAFDSDRGLIIGGDFEYDPVCNGCEVPTPNTGFVAVAAGEAHSLGLKAHGSIEAWGYGNYGQTNVPAPNSGFVAVAAGGQHSLGLNADGSIVGWGYNYYGQTNVPAPNTGFVGVAAGSSFSLGLKADGSIVAWGDNSSGQTNVPAPNSGFVAVAAGIFQSLGLKADGAIVAWGCSQPHNYYNGQCNVPAPNKGFIAVAAGGYHNLGLKADGTIVAWGDNLYGQTNVPAPNSGFVAVAAGSYHSLGLQADGSIVAWGCGSQYNYGQCNVLSPNTGFIAVAAGWSHSLGLKSDGSIVHWGQPFVSPLRRLNTPFDHKYWYGMKVAYGAFDKEVLLFGGETGTTFWTIYFPPSIPLWEITLSLTQPFNETWVRDSSGAWRRVATECPEPRIRHGMVFDASRDVVVLYGGQEPPPGQWEVYVETAVGGSETHIFPSLRPSATCRSERFSDPAHNTWEWDGEQWALKATRDSASFEPVGPPNERETVVFGESRPTSRGEFDWLAGRVADAVAECKARLLGGSDLAPCLTESLRGLGEDPRLRKWIEHDLSKKGSGVSGPSRLRGGR